MANHIYATAEFTDLNGLDWKITLRKMEAGTDSTKTFKVGGEGFVLTYENSDEYDLLSPIMGSSLEFTMMYEEGDRNYFIQMFYDVLNGTDGFFCIEVHRDQDSANELWWRGYLLPEAAVIEDIAPYEQATIRATDGLGGLDAIDFTGATEQQLHHGVLHCLNELPYTELYTAADSFGIFVDDFIASNYALYSTDYSTYRFTHNYLKVSHETWYNIDNDGVAQHYSCKEYLRSLCLSFNARLYQHRGRFYFVPMGALQDGEDMIGGIYSNAYSYQGTEDIEHNASYGGGTYYIKSRGWVQTACPAHGEITIERNYQGDKAILSRANLAINTEITDEGANYIAGKRLRVSGNFLYQFDGIATGNTDNNRYGRILLSVKLQVGQSAAAADFINRPYSIGTSSFIHASGDQYDNDFANTLELGADAYGEIEWTQTSDDRYHIILPFIVDRENGTAQTLQDGFYLNKHFTFVTPPLPTDREGLKLTVYATGIEADGSTNTDYLDTNYADYQLRNVRVQYTTVTQEQEFGTVEISAKAAGRYDVDLGTTYIGDRIASENFGVLETLGSGSYEECTDWRSRMSTTAGLSLNKLAVNERMGFYKRGKIMQRGTLISTLAQNYLRPHTILSDVDDGYTFFITTLRFVATTCEYDVSLIANGRNIASITLAEDNPRPSRDVTANDPGNVPNPASMKGDDIITNAFYNYNKRARQNFSSSWTSIIGTDETKEVYWTLSNDGYGRYVDYQGESAAAGNNIQRTVYVQTRGLQTPSDSGWQTPSAVQPSLDDTLAQTLTLIQEYINKVGDHGAYTFMVTWEEVAQNQLLDDYSGATAAYSLRKLRQAYTGSAIVVRRSSDNTTSSIGFDSGGNLNETALLSFVGTGGTDNGFVVSMYDQTGNGNTLTQTATSSQPQIVSAGVVNKVNGRAAMLLDGTNDNIPAATNFNANSSTTEMMVLWVGTVTHGASGMNLVSHWASSTASQVFQVQWLSATSKLRYQHRYSNGTQSTADLGTTTTSGNQYIVCGHTEQNKHEAWFNGTKYSGTNVNAAPNSATTSFRMGARSDNSAGPHSGYTQEIVVWSSTGHLHDGNSISTDVNSYYTVY